MVKKLFLTLLLVMLSVPLMAADPVITMDSVKDHGGGAKLYTVKVVLVSDGAGSDRAEFNVSAYFDKWSDCTGGWFIGGEAVPATGATAPDAAFTLAFDSDKGSSLLDLATVSNSAPTYFDGAADVDGYPPVFDIGIDIGDLGTGDEAATIYLYIYR